MKEERGGTDGANCSEKRPERHHRKEGGKERGRVRIHERKAGSSTRNADKKQVGAGTDGRARERKLPFFVALSDRTTA